MKTPISEVSNESCMEMMARFPDGFFDLAITDPPYFEGVGKLGYFGEKQSSINVKRGNYNIPQWDKQIPDEKYLKELMRVSKHQIIWGINYYKFFHTAGRIIWDKVNGDSSFSDAEIASCTFHDSVRMFRYMWNGMLQAKSLSEPETMQGNKKLNEKRIHPTQKPVALYKWLLHNYATAGSKILDTHLGSGSSRIAAYLMGFDFWATELDKDYFDAQEKRFKEQTAQGTLFNYKESE
jgi:site-specific DNA-methyltransferase (adenine-specific)